MSDSNFATFIGAILVLVSLASGYGFAYANQPKWVDCEATLYSDTHMSVIKVMKCEVKP